MTQIILIGTQVRDPISTFFTIFLLLSNRFSNQNEVPNGLERLWGDFKAVDLFAI